MHHYQRIFILEGTAQLLDFDGYKSEVKQMFANEELVLELFDEWVLLMRDLKGDSPQTAFSAHWENHYEKGVDRLKRYWPGELESHAYRPCGLYYLSYHIYISIYESAGFEKLMYVIENPAKLLSVYNELRMDSMLVPRIPDDIVILWQENL